MQDPIDLKPRLIQAEPVLAVTNVRETISYWTETLGFPNHWVWGDPPNHGGVSWNGSAAVQFTLDPELAALSAGNAIWILMRNITELYERHQKKANIVAPLKTQPWGFVEYTVKDTNGYYINFSSKSDGYEPSRHNLPDSVSISHKKPQLQDVRDLLATLQWTDDGNNPSMQEQIDAAITIVCAERESIDRNRILNGRRNPLLLCKRC